MNKFTTYIKRTFKNKLFAIGMIAVGVLSIVVLKDLSAMVFMGVFGIPLLFTSKNYFD